MRLLAFFLSVICASFTSLATASSTDSEETVSCTSLTATGNSEYPPFLWRESGHNNKLLGANVIILEEIGRRTKLNIEVVHVGPWSRAQSEVKAGRVDLMAGAFYTNERSEYMDYFSPTMLHTTSVVWQNVNQKFEYNKKEDLVGHWGVTVINNSFGQSFDAFARENLNILSVASLSQAIKMLEAGRVDYALYEQNPGQAYATMMKVQDRITARQPAISSEGLFLTISKKSECNTFEIRQKIALALRNMKREGFNDKALARGLANWADKAEVATSEK
ncbi:substrate-binding periplasmic protein [Marinomonas mediterranea]|jgi:amino acid ABC transporter substrate-binding protein, PAAT family (TC 3.A.1.3.-)|nr:transporter substrate-binding domain-containing protein [Marinomonas mediterranea]WCN08424.1 transporter substrate-binding domain-containing protein [Marinomonas mediterranea]WCN12478.1 transporter substrate-binding domain-containing protein [Marinomonas mediterranea]WCN16550.1 transporter substrate-binding domain-containing protein [Marinomonas mediterranea MMB-1]